MSNKIFEALAIMAIIAVSAGAQNAEWYGAGGGKEGKTFHISTEDDLKGLAQLVNSGFDDFNGKTIILNADITLKGAHTPIGDDKKQFMGVFDGNGKTISGLSVSNFRFAGLFGYVGKDGQIKNLTVNVLQIAVVIESGSCSIWNRSLVGGLAGVYSSAKAIENCGVNIRDSISVHSHSRCAYFSDKSFSGGLVGYVEEKATITNSYTTGNVSSSGYSGGLVGYAKDATITNSYATSNASDGGLVGYVENATITNSYTTGNASGGLVGGVGHWMGGSGGDITITNSYTTGNASNGGLVGYSKNATITITDSYTTGDVVSKGWNGGLVGSGGDITITNSYTTGNVSSENFSGGLVGSASHILITNSYALGNIFGSSTGGLVGVGNTIEISNSYAIGNVSGTDAKDIFSGGLIGRANESSTLANCYASGTITGQNKGGIMGYWKEGNNTSVYFNNTAGDMTAASGLPAGLLGVGVTEEKLKNQETFKGWDFEKIWAIDAEINDGYPYLRTREKELRERAEQIKKIAKTETFGTITDNRDKKKYKTVKIGSQVWMAENLSFNAKGSKCYDNKPANCNKYGRLYDWNTARSACPKGWHLPTDAEWAALENAVGGSWIAGNQLKAKSGWNNNGNGTDAYGFAALPGGNGDSNGRFRSDVGGLGYWWSSTEGNTNTAWLRYILHNHKKTDRSYDLKNVLLSARCVQDSAP
jgi:uncharacterized protein (TIGR02145 family)